MFSANINIAPSNTFGLTDSLCNDVVFYTSNQTQRILIGTSNSAGLTINSNSVIINNNLGINNNNPLYSLDVTGNINYTGNLYKNNALYTGWTTSNSNLYIIGSNVGIGKSNPLYNLDVVGTVGISSNLIINNNLTISNIVYSSNNVNVLGSVIINSNLSVSNLVNINGIMTTTNIMPLSNLIYDIGSSTMRFRSIYLASNTIDMAGTQLHVDASGLRVTNSNNSNTTITVNQIQLGTDSNAITIGLDTNNNFNISSITLSNGITVASNSVSVGTTGLLTIDNSNPIFISSNTNWTTITSSNIIYSPVMTLTVDSSGIDAGFGIELDSSNNIYVCGYYNAAGGPTIYNSNGVSSGLVITASGGQGGYIAKYNSNGTALWVANIDGTGAENTNSVVVDSSNNVIVTGSYNTIPNIYNSGNVLVNTSNIASLGTPCNSGAYIVKYNSNGTVLWTTHIDSVGYDSGNGVTCDTTNNIYVAGTSTTSNGIIYDMGSNVVTTFAGSGVSGYADGTGTNAILKNPRGICIDSSGNLYIADKNNHCIRKITSAGVVTTLAGTVGVAAYLDGTGTNAKFNTPSSIVVDVSGNLYLTDQTNCYIRKITSAGVVTTIAGNGTPGFADGTGTNAVFSNPYGIDIDSSGNLYIGDTLNHRIRKITSAGVVTTLAGNGTTGYTDGTGSNATFYNPGKVVLDSSGNIFVADINNHKIRKVTSVGVVTTFAGSGAASYGDGIGTNSGFNNPKAIAIDLSGNIYVGDLNNNRVRKITSAGVVTTIAGSGTATYLNGAGTNAGFNGPDGLCVDTSGNLYISDTNNNVIRKNTTNANVSSTISLLPVGGSLTDRSAFVVKYDSNGVSKWTVSVDGVNNLDNGASVCVDTSQNVYLVGTYGSNLATIYQNASISGNVTSLAASGSNAAFGVKINASGVPQWAIRIDGTDNDQALGSCVDAAGNFYIAGSYNTAPNFYNSNNTTLGTNILTSSLLNSNNSAPGYKYLLYAPYYTGLTNNQGISAPTSDFSQNIGTNQPLYSSSGGYSNLPYIKFQGGTTSNYFSANNITYNIATNGGFTCMMFIQFNSNAAFPRIFTTGSPGYLEVTQNGLNVQFDMNTSGNFYITTTTNPIVLGEWAVYTFRLNSSTNTVNIYKDYTSLATGTSLYSSNVTQSSNLIGKSMNVDPFLTANVTYMAIYDSFVSDVALSNMVSIIYNPQKLPAISDSTYTSAFLTKYNTSGVAQWATSIKGVSGSNIARSVVSDSNNNIYLTGSYHGTVSPTITDMNGSNSGLSLPVPTGNNGSLLAAFVVKYNSSGVPLNAYGIVGPASTANSIAVTNSNIYIAGYLYTNTILYNSAGMPALTYPVTINSQGAYIAQYSPVVSPYYLSSSFGASNNGLQKYITNASTSNIILKIPSSNNASILNTYTLTSNSTMVFNWFNSWYKMG
jgi:sugar lactone lactonase YvrE